MNPAAVAEAEAPLQTCSACRRSFRGPGALQNHLRSCSSAKKRLCRTLTAAKDIVAKKRRKKDGNAVNENTAKSTAMVRYYERLSNEFSFNTRF